ncbi:MAG: hypothetical protein ABI852_09690, partial [Gemmatimonadaceae bacterium]
MISQTHRSISQSLSTRSLRAATFIACAWLAASCNKGAAASDGPYSDIVEKAIPKLEEIVGLKFKSAPKLERRTKAEVRDFLMKQLNNPKAVELLAGQSAVYRGLGLIPDSLDVADLLQRLLEEQIIGYYDPTTKVLYVVDGTPKLLLTQTITHELVHALQDQYVKVDSIQGNVEDADRQSAAQAVLEGQAVYAQLAADPNAGPMLRMPGGWDRIRDVIKDGQTGMPVFSSAPRVIREGLLFPYIGGADFTRRFIAKRKPSEMLTDLPITTRQVLNDDAYFGKRDSSWHVTLPKPSVGTITYSNTMGEFETRLALVQHLKDEVVARRAASGIDGDRVAVIKTPEGNAVVWATVWDDKIQAAEFFDQWSIAISKRYKVGAWEGPAGSIEKRFNIPGEGKRIPRIALLKLISVNGRPVVV